MNPVVASPSSGPRGIVLLVCLFALPAFSRGPGVQAQPSPTPPERMTYQGYLTDANGVPLGKDGPKNYDVIFRLWKSESSTAAPDRLWTEQQTVTVDQGYFSVLLGEGSAIGESRPALSTVFSGPSASERWMGITVKGIGNGGADVDILPRLRMLSSPYAFLATRVVSVDGAKLTSGTIPDARLSSNVARRNGGNTFEGAQIIQGGVLRLDQGQSLEVAVNNSIYPVLIPRAENNQTLLNYGSAGFSIRNQAGYSAMFFDNARRVGIGTTAPQATLELQGTARILKAAKKIQSPWYPVSTGQSVLGVAPTDGFLTVIVSIVGVPSTEKVNVRVQGLVNGLTMGAASAQYISGTSYWIKENSFMMPVPKGAQWKLIYYEDYGHDSQYHGRIHLRWTAIGR